MRNKGHMFMIGSALRRYTVLWRFLLASCLQFCFCNLVRDGIIRIIICQERRDFSGQKVTSVRKEKNYLCLVGCLILLSLRDSDSTPALQTIFANCDYDISVKKSVQWL